MVKKSELLLGLFAEERGASFFPFLNKKNSHRVVDWPGLITFSKTILEKTVFENILKNDYLIFFKKT